MKDRTDKTPPTIYINDASLSYAGNVLFNNLSLTITSGKLTCLLGPSGVGKTTLLRIIANLIPQDVGYFKAKIRVDNNLPLENQINYLQQGDSLLPWLNAIENVLIGYRLRGELTDEKRSHANALFLQVGLASAVHKYPRQLSGGMRQRVALIRTLLEDKPIVLMDEPFSALDAITRFQLQSLASNLLKNRTVFLVTHDPLEALRLADEIYILAGQPAKLSLFAKLGSSAPRDFSDIELISNQGLLFEALNTAKEISACV